ncbi:MAG TPA: nitroreductase family protein, partial [Gemmatimonadales bacterium]|nr:nitroreductase family protein [Gemmatimonadales bacterium]
RDRRQQRCPAGPAPGGMRRHDGATMTDTLLQPWAEAIDEFPIEGTHAEQLCAAARRATLAPSSHNTQPWLFRVSGSTLDLYADRSRAQPIVDPDQRELTISCGAALYIIRLTLARFGLDTRCRVLPDPRDPDLLARVTLDGTREPDVQLQRLYNAISTRRTNRNPFEERPIPRHVIARIVAAVEAQGARIQMVSDELLLANIAELVAEADRAQMASTAFRHELAQSIHFNRSPKRDGMPGHALGLGDLASALGPVVVRNFDLGPATARRDVALIAESPALAVLWSRKDTPRHWLRTGQALAALLLNLQADGVSASFLNQPMQVVPLRERLRALLDCPGSPQLVLRLGYAPDVAPTPRRDPDEVIVNLSPRVQANFSGAHHTMGVEPNKED